jgi:8-oxo-dGTP pyrophosphatase MutT (NUDIX family)
MNIENRGQCVNSRSELTTPEQLALRLRQGDLPGRAAQARFEPQLSYGRHLGPPPDDARAAAVIMLLFPEAADWRLPLVLRPASLAHHAGQIGLPGGVVEVGETSDQAALRELQEEIGVPPASVQMIGQLSPLYVYGTNFLVSPWLAWTPQRPVFCPCAAEVDEVLEISLNQLTDERHIGRYHRQLRGIAFSAPALCIGEHCIWGATAMMLAELAAIVGNGARE